MGMPVEVLRSLVNGERLPTSAEADSLAAYFQTVPDAFLTVQGRFRDHNSDRRWST
jgi:plasmid maintenance system antidote protein VapI